MKTLCYKISFVCKGYMYNDGFVIVKIGNDGEILSSEGILTNDYIILKTIDSVIKIEIYSNNYSDCSIFLENTKIEMGLIFQGVIQLDEFELPINCEFDCEESTISFELKTIANITSEFNKYNQMLKEYKQYVFNSEWI